MQKTHFVVCMLIGFTGLGLTWAAEPAGGLPLSDADRKELLAQRDQLWEQAQKLDGEGQLNEAIAAGEKLLRLYERIFGDTDKELTATLQWLADRYSQAERFDDARSAVGRNRQICRQAFGKDAWQVVIVHWQADGIERLAAASPALARQAISLETECNRLSADKKYREAVGKARELAAVEERIYGESHPWRANTSVSIANWLIRLGDFATAESVAVKCVSLLQAKLGAHHPDMAVAIEYLAVAQYGQQKYAPAAQAFARAAGIYERLQRPVNAARMHSARGDCHRDLKQDDLAVAAYEKALAVFTREEDNEGIANTAQALGMALFRLQRFRDAAPQFEAAAKAFDTLGQADEAASMYDLQGAVYRRANDPAKAITAYREAVARFEKLKDQEGQLLSAEGLAEMYERRQDFARAVQVRRDALRLAKEVYGEQPWKVTDARLALQHTGRLAKLTVADGQRLAAAVDSAARATALHDAGKYQEASVLAHDVWLVHKELLGEEDPDTTRSLTDLAILYVSMNDAAKAEPLLKRAVTMWKKLAGVDHDHPERASCVDILARTQYAQRKYAEALQGFVEAAEMFERLKQPPDAAWMHSFRGACYGGLKQDELAVAAYEKALAVFTQEGDSEGIAATASELGIALHQLKRFRDAIPHFQAAAKAYDELEQAGKAAWMHSWLGECFSDIHDHAQAIAAYRESVARFEKLGDERGRLRCARGLAHAYEEREDFTAAAKSRTDALRLTEQLCGKQPWKIMDARLALQHTAKLAQLTRADRQRLAAAADWEEHLSTLRYTGRYKEALDLAQKMWQVRKELLGAEHPDTARSLGKLGGLYFSMNDFKTAEPLLQQALETQTKVLGLDHDETANGLFHLGNLYSSMGDSAKAELLIRQSLEIWRNILGARHPNAGKDAHERTASHEEIGEDSEAELEYGMALATAAFCYLGVGEYAKAEPLFREALASDRQTWGPEHPFTAHTLLHLGLVYALLGDYAKAEQHCREALVVGTKVGGPEGRLAAFGRNNLGLLYILQGDYAKAEPLYREALKTFTKIWGEEDPTTANALLALGLLSYSKGDYAKAESFFRKSLDISRKNLELASLIQSQRQQLAMTQALRQYLDFYLSLAVESGTFDEAAYQQVAAWKGMVLARQQASRAVASRPDLQPKWAQLQSVCSQLATYAFRNSPAEQLPEWQRRMAELSSRKERLEAEIADKSAAFRQATRPVDLAELRAALPEGCVLVDFLEYWQHVPKPQGQAGRLDGASHLAAFVVRKNGTAKLVPLGPVAPLSKAIDTWRAGFGITKDSADAGTLLRKDIWERIEGSLVEGNSFRSPDNKTAGVDSPLPTILVSPDGALGRLPLSALPGRQSGTYLLEDWPLATLPASRSLLALREVEGRKRPTGNLLVLGDVNYDSRLAAPPAKPTTESLAFQPRGPRAARDDDAKPFPSLPGTKGELTTIKKRHRDTFGESGLTTLAGAAATKESLRREAPQHRYLHLATHGFFAAPKFRSALERRSHDLLPGGMELLGKHTISGYHPGLLSGLVLAGANRPTDNDDGILTAEEVATLDLTAVDLAVLSACETILGEAAGGEGLLGLQRAFQTAGARTTVASLWKVSDFPTQRMMERFYGNLWNREKPMGKLAAVREAQLWMLREGRKELGIARGLKSLPEPGIARGLDFLPEPAPDGTDATRLPPYYWAAFVLSGDWR